VNTKCLILLLAQYTPRSFVSGAPIGLGKVLKSYNKNEFHHCFPRAFLKSRRLEPADYNKLANYVFMSAGDNKRLGGAAPSVYREHIYGPAIAGILEHALCPESLFADDYETFLMERSTILANAANVLCDQGEPPALGDVPVDPAVTALAA
jgi:hypothetical protein